MLALSDLGGSHLEEGKSSEGQYFHTHRFGQLNFQDIGLHLRTELKQTLHEAANLLMCFKTHVRASPFPHFRREVFLVPVAGTTVIQKSFHHSL